MRHHSRYRLSRASALLAAGMACLVAGTALAGPPYDTDDPEPTDPGHWEVYAFAAGTRGGASLEGSFGLDLNYGALPGVQLTATLPADFANGSQRHFSAGDAELGIKYQFLRREGFSLALFPRVILPTGQRSGPRRAAVLLPAWAERDIGPWSIFGGGGFTFNPGPANRNFWRAGLAVTREVTPRLSLGAEATREGPTALGERAHATFGLGGIYRLHGPFSLLVSAGPAFTDGGHRASAHGYAALAMNF